MPSGRQSTSACFPAEGPKALDRWRRRWSLIRYRAAGRDAVKNRRSVLASDRALSSMAPSSMPANGRNSNDDASVFSANGVNACKRIGGNQGGDDPERTLFSGATSQQQIITVQKMPPMRPAERWLPKVSRSASGLPNSGGGDKLQ